MLLLADFTRTVPTHPWSPTTAIIMIVCNILAIASARFAIKYPNAGPQLPASNMFGGFGLPAVLAATSFGHIIGTGVIIGLANLGVI